MMSDAPTSSPPSANPTARVVDLRAYRAARRRETDVLPLFAQPFGGEPACRVLSPGQVAHRERMLRHLAEGAGLTGYEPSDRTGRI